MFIGREEKREGAVEEWGRDGKGGGGGGGGGQMGSGGRERKRKLPVVLWRTGYGSFDWRSKRGKRTKKKRELIEKEGIVIFPLSSSSALR